MAGEGEHKGPLWQRRAAAEGCARAQPAIMLGIVSLVFGAFAVWAYRPLFTDRRTSDRRAA